jgi:hypothetical protein
MQLHMAKLTISKMVGQVPEGGRRVFERSVKDAPEERFFRVWQNWDYKPGRLEWLNSPPIEDAPWLGTSKKKRIGVETIPTPDVQFKGPSKDVVDFYGTGNHAFFISDALFRLIDEVDPGSLDHVAFFVRARDGDLPFHAVMPRRVIDAIDLSRTTVLVADENYHGHWSRTVSFPDGIIFDERLLHGIESVSDLQQPGWYWSKELIELAKERDIRGLYARSVASPRRQIARM